MGLTKQYLRFAAAGSFGLVGSAQGGVATLQMAKGLVASAAVGQVLIWDMKRKVVVCSLEDEEDRNAEVTAMEARDHILAVGYKDGMVRLWDIESRELIVPLKGHKSPVSSLAFDHSGSRLASGGKDTHIIVWDVVNECGLFRLRGHKGPITRIRFLKSKNVLVSSSKDTFVKFWDLDIQHCFSTLTGHLSEVWDFALVKEDKYLVTGCNDAELRVYRLTFREDQEEAGDGANDSPLAPQLKKLRVLDEFREEEEDGDKNDVSEDDKRLVIERLGALLRTCEGRVAGIEVDSRDRLLACYGDPGAKRGKSGDSNAVEFFLVCSKDEVAKRLQKKAKKERRKVPKGNEAHETTAPLEATIKEEFRRLAVVRAGGRVKAVRVACARGDQHGLLSVLNANNMIQQFRISLDEKIKEEIEKVSELEHAGHRSDVRTVSFSSDNTAVLSGSHESVKVWSRSAQCCNATVSSGYCLSSLFVPGDRQFVVGTKSGSIQIFDLAASEMIEEVSSAHNKEVWGLALRPDKKGFMSASADKTVKFWDFELVAPSGSEGGKVLSVVHRRTLDLQEEALAVRLSDDGRLVAVALLDSTVKLFFVDSLKFFLSLYGHKLPVLSMDISTDSKLIATGGEDKNVKIWGLDFGDCHRSLFAHDDSVVAVRFLPNTHMFFTAGKDGKVKQWDADNFERILTLHGHSGPIRDLTISSNGRFVISAGHDKTLRLWQQTEEILVLEDERETEREREEDLLLATGDERVVAGQQNQEASLPTKKTAESERGAEKLLEAMQLYREYQQELLDFQEEVKSTGNKAMVPPAMPPLMAAYMCKTPEDYMTKMIENVKSSEVEQTLLVLSFSDVIHLLSILDTLLRAKKSPEVLCRMFFFIIEVHYGPLSVARDHAALIQRVRDIAKERLQELRDCVGFNVAGLQYHQNRLDERTRALELVEAVGKYKKKRSRKKNQEKALHTAIMSL